MAEKHLIKAIGEKYAKMSRQQRVKTIRSLSTTGLNFIRKFFPVFYAEAFPAQIHEVRASWGSETRPALCAKTR
jgi:hypothetical protein